jgi:hypothetical protein
MDAERLNLAATFLCKQNSKELEYQLELLWLIESG